MNNQPTPETDDIARGNHVVPTEWAQQLERERDEAMEEIKEWKTLCLWGGTPEHIHGFIRGQQSRIQHLERERDEARESLKHISEYGTDEINAAVELRQKLATALVERDEAREEANKLSGAYEDATNYYARIIQLKEELDEAREALVKILKNE